MRYYLDRVVWIDVEKLNAAGRAADSEYYLDVGGVPIDDLHYRYARFGQWLAGSRVPVWMPSICLYESGVSFVDGRHRFVWLRDRRVKALPVTADPEEAPIIAERYGSETKVCRLPSSTTSRAG